jgi:exopolyphosphatase/guanosine-5'-triphosphate,3'-diphosphate pyrophosphatase
LRLNTKRHAKEEFSHPGSEAAFPLRCASVDVGSNALRFLAAEFSALSTYAIIEEQRNPVRLGHGVFLTGRLSADVMDEAIAVFSSYRERMKVLGIDAYRAVATSAVRDSANGVEFLRRVREAAGLELSVISGSEEARLVHRAITSRLDLNGGPWMLVDLGGGSVEVSLADESGILWSESHTMGAVRLLEELTGSAEDPGRFLKLLTEYAGTLRVPSGLESERPVAYAATGGNIETLADMALSERGPEGVRRLPVEDLARLIQQLARLSYRERVEKLGLKEDRADVILPAAIVYERLARLAGAREILVPGVGVKEGIILDLVDGLSVPLDLQDKQARQVAQAALSLGRKYRFDEPHGMHVAMHALSLFDQLGRVHGLGEEDRRILHAAAVLHDIGSFVSYTRHHKHTLYLISNSNLQGFTPREILLVANVARYHRRSEPKPTHEPFTALDREERRRVTILASLLRLADALDREHRQTVRRVKARIRSGRLSLTLRGTGDMLLEGWALKKKSDLFQRLFSLDVEIVTEPEEEP